MAVQAPTSTPGTGGAPQGGTAGPAPADPTGQIDQNMSNTQAFQNKANADQSMWQAKMSLDEKGWKVLESVINDLKQ